MHAVHVTLDVFGYATLAGTPALEGCVCACNELTYKMTQNCRHWRATHVNLEHNAVLPDTIQQQTPNQNHHQL